MSNRLVTEGLNALREAYGFKTTRQADGTFTFDGKTGPNPVKADFGPGYGFARSGDTNYLTFKGLHGLRDRFIKMPDGSTITGTGRASDAGGAANMRRIALGEQGSLLDFVNSVAPAGGRKTRSQGSLTDFVNRVAPSGGSSASSGTSTNLKEPRTLKNYATNNHLGGYTSKDKMFNSADLGPGRYTATDSMGNEYDSNSMTIRGFGRGVQSRTFTGTGRSNVK